MFKRVILKISGEGLAGGTDEHYDKNTIARIVAEVTTLVSWGTELALVVGGGNIWRGRDASAEMDKVKAHQIGMLATVMNAMALAEGFRIHTGGGETQKCVVMTPFEVGTFTERFTKEKALACMQAGLVPIFAGGTGHPFFSTDSIVAIRACELAVQAVLYGKSVDCVYEADPRKHPAARRYKTVSYASVLAKQLDVADMSATSLTAKEGIDAVVFALDKPGSIVAACRNDESLYTVFGGTRISHHVEDVFYE